MPAFLSRFRIAAKLWLGYSLVAAILAGLALIQLRFLHQEEAQTLRIVENRLVPVRQLKIVSDAYGLRILFSARQVRGGTLAPAEGLVRVRSARREAGRQWAEFKASAPAQSDPEVLARGDALMVYVARDLDRLEQLLAEVRLPELGRFVDDDLLPQIQPLTDLLAGLVQTQEDAAQRTLEEMGARSRRTRLLSYGMILAGLAAALALGYLIARDLSGSIRRMVAQVRRAAEGDLEARVAIKGRDELADMARELNRMIARLRDTIEALDRQKADLWASEARAQTANRAKSAFLSNMSHELRTPLNAILGYAQLMARRGGRSAEDQDQLARILEAGEHLLTLINDVLSLSKIESGGLELRTGSFATAALLEGVLDMQRIRAEAKGLELRLEVDPALPAHLEGDAAKLRQVLVNLLGNAVKFTQRGSVTLRVDYAQGRAGFAVEDTGPGISEEDQRQLLQAFFQAGGPAQAAEGTGLGLHISRSLVHLMGGELALHSRLGEGSRFSFSLPLPEGEPPLELEDRGQVVGLEPGQRPVKMLVVDDRPENRDLLAQLLHAVGFQVQSAGDGVEALELWERHRPDLIWMDLRMPRMSGFEALQILRGRELEQDLPHTFVVAISASVIDLDREALRKSGFDDFLGKPFREAHLFEIAGRLLGLRFLTREPEAAPGSCDLGALKLQPEAWRADLKDAVLIGDTEAALALVDQLGANPMADGLRHLLRAYKLQELLDTLDR